MWEQEFNLRQLDGEKLTAENQQLRNEMAVLRFQMRALEQRLEHETASFKEAMRNAKKHVTDLRSFVDLQQEVDQVLIKKLTQDSGALSECLRKVKAILRVPMLSKKFHDLMKQENWEEYDLLDAIYCQHFNLQVNELDRERQRASYKNLALVDRHLVHQYKQPFTPFSASDPFTEATSKGHRLTTTENTL